MTARPVSPWLRPFERIRLRALGRDWWPEEERRPYLRAALALIAPPIILAAALALVDGAITVAEIYFAPQDPTAEPPSPLLRVQDAFLLFARDFFGPVFAPAAAAFLALWSLRFRHSFAFTLGGVLSGLVGCAVSAAQLGFFSLAAGLAVMALHVALLRLAHALARVAPRAEDAF